MQSFYILYVASPSGPLPRLFIWCPWGQIGIRPACHKLKHKNKEGKLWNSSSLKQEGVELWSFGLELWYLDLYQFYSYATPGVKTGPIPGVISWNNSNGEGRIHFMGKLTQVSDSGPSWPSCFIMAKDFNIQTLFDGHKVAIWLLYPCKVNVIFCVGVYTGIILSMDLCVWLYRKYQ